MPETTRLSIIIPSYQRAEGLHRLLESIWKLQPWAKQVEVIIVDNAREVQAEYVRIQGEFFQKGMRVKVVLEPVAGVARARNTGIKIAAGEWLCFLDDDEELPEGYLELLFGKLASADKKTIFGGSYIPIMQKPGPEWIKADYYKSDSGDQPMILANEKYLFGGNLFFSRSLVDQVGFFSYDFGHTGLMMDYGEDTEFLVRAIKIGASQLFDPKLFVWHHIHSRKQTIKWLIKRKQHSSWQKAYIYFIRHTEIFTVENRFRNLTYFLQTTIRDFFEFLFRLAGILFRDRGDFPFYQNYYVEKVLPVYGNLLLKWRILLLVTKQPLLG